MAKRREETELDPNESEKILDQVLRRDGTPNAGVYESDASNIGSNPDAGFDFDANVTDEEESGRRSER
jgi:hypothetical protein